MLFHFACIPRMVIPASFARFVGEKYLLPVRRYLHTGSLTVTLTQSFRQTSTKDTGGEQRGEIQSF